MVPERADDEKAVVRRYTSVEALAEARLEVLDGEAVEEVRSELVAASGWSWRRSGLGSRCGTRPTSHRR
jgi:hypothetical protein